MHICKPVHATFSCLSVNGDSGCFHLLTVVNNARMNECANVFEFLSMFVFYTKK